MIQEFQDQNPLLFQKPPDVMADSFTQFFTDIYDLIKSPSASTLTKLVGNFSLFWLVPLSAGYMRLEAHKQYLADKDTYDAASITEQQIYSETFSTIKAKYWELLGKM
ncbi:UNKNOWN [Stylonychia lemnae]|uniref:Uncharacterized protein n=1 Tax=Stylonychia lemnae TaxID=5949 RepID=A0A078B9B0_STYLE|nr:UNKNOWN [Stylonychia lemnae]|eukprot:CDW90816.1 UNKNOWN [Stylonychia lemnae]